jgi:putative spermidine/putrescine transport system substrate-binding protein
MKARQLLGAGIFLLAGICAADASAQTATCYNCPPEWADWKTQIRVIKEETGISVPPDNKNSGQTLAQLIAEKNNPVADIAHFGVGFAIQARDAGVLGPYKPAKHWDEIAADLKDAEGYWHTIYYGTLGLFVNVDALGGKPVPKGWKELADPKYKGMVGYLDPSSSFVGVAAGVAINRALGGSLEDFTPGIRWFAQMARNDAIVPKQTSYARVVSGEIPILIDYDFNAYRAQYQDKVNARFVIPEEGSLIVPYVMGLVKGGPQQANGKKVLDFLLTDKGQAVFANAFVRPIRPGAASAEARAKFLPDAEYARASGIDFRKVAQAQDAFIKRYLAEGR